MNNLITFLLKDKKISCGYCGSAIFQLGFGLAHENGFKDEDITTTKDIIKEKCRNSESAFHFRFLLLIAALRHF